MDDESKRFTAWLTGAERQAIVEASRRHHVSQNVIVRLAIRKMLNLDSDESVSQNATNPPQILGL